jgi:nickel-dependent lactate racemase
MSEQRMTLPWGKEEIALDLPEGWRLNGVLEPSSRPGVDDPVEAVRGSVESPIGSPRLCDMIEEGMQVTVVIDDLSRPTPVDLILPTVLEELRRGGVRQEEITLVTALGVHRPMTEEEMAARVGGDLLRGLRWENHDCDVRRQPGGCACQGPPALPRPRRGVGLSVWRDHVSGPARGLR